LKSVKPSLPPEPPGTAMPKLIERLHGDSGEAGVGVDRKGEMQTAGAADVTRSPSVMHTSDMRVLLDKTRTMTLTQLEVVYGGRFNKGEIREMKQEFDNIAKSSAARAGAADGPPLDTIDSRMMRDLLVRGSSSSTAPNDVELQKTLVAFDALGCERFVRWVLLPVTRCGPIPPEFDDRYVSWQGQRSPWQPQAVAKF